PSVSFYDMPVTLLLRGASQGKSYVVDHQYSGQEFSINPGFIVDTVIIDPELSILTKIKKATKKVTTTSTNEVKIFPNPSPGELYISLLNPTDKKLYIRLYNSIGQLVFQKDIETSGNDELIAIPATSLAKGTYMLQVRSEKAIKMVKKIVR
ncbi:MAG: T9SS type A sorting domain-containing protein, partial [Chitinophagaceae bacterium]